MATTDTGGRSPTLRARVPADAQTRMRTRAAQLEMGIGEYLEYLIRKDAEEIEHIFHRIDPQPAKKGGK